MKSVIDNLRKKNYEKCKFLWLPNFKEIEIPSFKFIIFLFDYVDVNLKDKIEKFYRKGNITVLCSIFNISLLIEKYDCNFIIHKTDPYFHEVEILLDILYSKWYFAIGEMDYLHLFTNSKNICLMKYVIKDDSEDSFKKFETFMYDTIEKIPRNKYKLLLTNIKTKDRIKANSNIAKSYSKYEKILMEEKILIMEDFV